MNSDLVLQDLADGQEIKCITEHPGFRPVCLEKWSLRMAADKFRTKGKQRYIPMGGYQGQNLALLFCSSIS